MALRELQVGGQRILCDREATIAVYEKIDRSWADGCQCPSCKNFLAQRDRVYPSSFLALLDQFGIDPNKGSEIIEYPILADYSRDQLHKYNGWLNFIGESVSDSGSFTHAPDVEEFEFWLSPHLPGLGAFHGRPSIAIEFETQLRWMIPERPESHDAAGNKYIWTDDGKSVKVKPER